MLKAKDVLVAFAITYVLVILTLGSASASMSVSRSTIIEEVSPGNQSKYEIMFSISEDNPATDFLTDVLGYGQTIDGSTAEIKANLDKSPYTARSFLNVTPTAFRLEPGKSQAIILETNIPLDVGQGARYALVNIHTLPKGNESVVVSFAYDIPVILSIKDTQRTKTGEITNIELSNPISAKQQNISVTIKNTGNYYYRAFATAELKDKDGNALANASTPVSFSSIIPTNSRIFKLAITPDSELKPGTYYVNSTVSTEDGIALATKETSFVIKS